MLTARQIEFSNLFSMHYGKFQFIYLPFAEQQRLLYRNYFFHLPENKNGN